MANTGSRVIVIDNGSEMCKAGMAGDADPKALVPPIVGRPSHKGGVLLLMSQRGDYVGEEVLEKEEY